MGSLEKIEVTERSIPASSGQSVSTSDDDFGEELYLTPCIKSGNLIAAKEKCRVVGLAPHIESYSGYLTVNEEYNSNLFFWFFPALISPETAPVILWLQGGPGSSSLIGLFNGFGPFSVNEDSELEMRSTTWANNHSVIFLDNPVGAGLSFTENDNGYARNQEDVCADLYEGLTQFFQIFPDFQGRDFYVAGQSYAGKYVPCLGVEIYQENLHVAHSKKINLKGLVIGSSFTDPRIQLNWGSFLYNMGLVDLEGKDYFDSETERMRYFIDTEQWYPAFEIMQKLMFAFPPPMTSDYEKVTGLSNTFNLLESDISPKFFHYRRFLEKPQVRKALHIGKRQLNFGETKAKVFITLAEDIPKSARSELEKLLNLDFKVLLYSSQFDVVVPHTAVYNLLKSLNWSKSEEFLRNKRKIWKVGNESAGFVLGDSSVSNLTHVFIRNAGHMATFDQPEWCFDMITRFTRNLTFDSRNSEE